MAQHLEQTQAAVQTQQTATLQVAMAKLVELSVAELGSRVQDEMLDNAALEEKDNGDFDTDDLPGDEDNGDGDSRDGDNAYEEPENYGSEADAMGDYFSDDDVPDYLKQRAEAQRERNDFQYSGAGSFYEDLRRQVSEYDLNEHEREVMDYLIGSIDEDGLLRKDLNTLADELDIYHHIPTSADELERLLGVLQQFEPRGIGARSLQECLRLQLTDPERRSPYTPLALKVVNDYFKQFTSRHWDVIRRRMGLDEETAEHVKHELTHLNPRPGSAFDEPARMGSPAVMPDFYVTVTAEGSVTVALNRGDVPELRVSPSFKESIRQYGGRGTRLSREQKDAYTYARQKVDAAQSFINMLQRRHDTLRAVMQAIADFQHDFFVNDDDDSLLRPLTLKDISDKTSVGISTVSRVTSTKYVQTACGMYSLKHFFSLQFTAVDGEELSARKVKAAVKALVDAEDKRHPLSDEAITAELKKQGYHVARRTVAKYRDMLKIPSTRLRREHG